MKTIHTRLRHFAPAWIALSAFMAAGCGDDAGSKGSSPARLTGNLQYESVEFDEAINGLDYSRITTKPIRGARVLLLDATNDEILAETTSTSMGTYSFGWSGSPNVKIWLYAETTSPSITVVDNTTQDAQYVLESPSIAAGTPTTFDLVATTGWTGSSYGKPRQSAPFSILDAAYTAATKIIAAGEPKPSIPKLEINWSVDNRPEDGNINLGQIGTSYWDGAEIYILGQEDVDTDEFDTHVIVHEWGHSFEDFLSRSDSQGGSHGFGDVLDPRLAFSEGFCNALSAIILEPNTVYSDSSKMKQSDGFWEDIDENDTSASIRPGWYSETTVQNVVFDLYDDDSNGVEGFDKVAIGLPGIYSVMANEMKRTSALTTLFPFVAALKSKNSSVTGAIDSLMTHHGNGSSFGIDPITDEWGTGETHGGNEPGTIPVYVAMKIGDSKTLTLTGGLEWTFLGQNRFARFTGNGSAVNISTTTTGGDDVDLFVYLRGGEVANSATMSGNESVQFVAKSGEEYVINVQGYVLDVNGPYEAILNVAP
jgi:hypothetical protein